MSVQFLKAEKCVAVQQTDAALTMQYIMYKNDLGFNHRC